MKKNLKIVNRSYTRKKYQDEKLRSRDYEFELKLKEALNFYETANYQEALEKLKYLKINNDYFLIHWYLGHTYFKLFEYNLAIQSIKKSIQLKSKDTLNLNFLAKLYKAINKHDLAILSLEEALDLDTKNKNTLISLAEAHTDKGNFEKAEKCYLIILEFEKNNFGIFYQLIKLKKKYLTQELVNRIKVDLNNITIHEEKIYANLILAQSANLKNDLVSEIELLNNAHFLYLKKKKIAAEQEWNYYSNLLPQFTKKSDNIAGIKIDNKIRPIFILGMPRSGTTLVESIITSGKESIAIGGETNALDSVFFKKNIIKDNNSPTLKTDFNFKKTDFESLKESLIEHYDQLKLINVNKNNIFTDKSITNFFYIDIIKKIFPNARFIYCSRNPLANILGIFKNFLPHLHWTHSLEKIFHYFDLFEKKLGFQLKTKDENFMVINLEELSHDPKKISKELYKFLDFEWSEDCIKAQFNNIIKTASSIQLRAPIKKHDLKYLKNYRNIFKEMGKKYEWYNR